MSRHNLKPTANELIFSVITYGEINICVIVHSFAITLQRRLSAIQLDWCKHCCKKFGKLGLFSQVVIKTAM